MLTRAVVFMGTVMECVMTLVSLYFGLSRFLIQSTKRTHKPQINSATLVVSSCSEYKMQRSWHIQKDIDNTEHNL